MTKNAIEVRNLSKKYHLGTNQGGKAGYKTLRESLVDTASMIGRKVFRRNERRTEPEEFLALDDVSFDVSPGDVVGVIGLNGAGKSTLLKIFSRITKPSKGSVTINGSVGSLLEVGTGFHPELTGRENIYLNGSILGMPRKEINRKFAAIVEFSEVEKFLDLPVKRYSSGMYVRLAFAVAAHLEPDILIIDEVLAVGDVAFQNKCIARLSSVASQGRTVMFVSHNTTAIQAICTKGVLLSHGKVKHIGSTQETLTQYLQELGSKSSSSLSQPILLENHPNRRNNSERLLKLLQIDGDDYTATGIPVGGAVKFTIHYEAHLLLKGAALVIVICTQDGQRLAMFHSRIHSKQEKNNTAGGTAICIVPRFPFLPGVYRVDVAIATNEDSIDYVEYAANLSVISDDVFGTGELPSAKQGILAIPCNWTL